MGPSDGEHVEECAMGHKCEATLCAKCSQERRGQQIVLCRQYDASFRGRLTGRLTVRVCVCFAPSAGSFRNSSRPNGEASGAVNGDISQGPCSNLQIGGSNNQQTGGNCAPPSLELKASDFRNARAPNVDMGPKSGRLVGLPCGSVRAEIL